MKETLDISNSDIEQLFERYSQAPESKLFVLLADACRKIGRADEALEICEKGIEIHPTYASGHVVKGKCLYDLDRHYDAQKAFEEVLTYDGDNLVALKYLGMMEAQAERYETAREYLTHILRIDPDNAEIAEALKHIKTQEDNDVVEASNNPSADETVESDSEEPVVLQVSDDATWKDEAPDAPGADEGPETEEQGELATVTLADIYADQGYTDKALKIYREILSTQPDNEAVKAKIAALSPSSDTTPIESPAPPAQEERRAEKKPARQEKTAVVKRRKKPRSQTADTPDDEKGKDHFNQWLTSLRK